MDKALKQRLVGAVVLIALAVIVLPMIFGGRQSTGDGETRTIELPTAPPDLDFETRRFPVGDQSEVPPTPDQGAETTDSTLPDKSSPPIPEADVLAQDGAIDEPVDGPMDVTQEDGGAESPPEDTADPASEAPEPGDTAETQIAGTDEADGRSADDPMGTLLAGLSSTETAPDPLRYVVQVASFGSNENAVRLAGQLEEAGYAVLLDNVSSETGQLNRVRVGPFGQESKAQEVAGKISAQFAGINPRIVDMQPDASAPALASDDPLMRWVVQVGSFSSQENATSLVSKLRESGLSAYDETVSTDNSTIHRVRVGPFLDRDDALAAEQKIGDSMGIDGVVMSSD